MFFNKYFATTLKIYDTIEFCTSKEEYTKRQLIQKYVGKCYDGVYVISIKKILRIGDCYYDKTNISATGTVIVEFIVECQQFVLNDVLFGVKVITDTGLQSGFIDTNPMKALVSIKKEKDPITDKDIDIPVRKDQLIPIKIYAVEYTYAQSEARITAWFKGCKKDIILYKVNGVVTKEIIDNIKAYLENLKDEFIIYNSLIDKIQEYEKLYTANKKLKPVKINAKIDDIEFEYTCMCDTNKKYKSIFDYLKPGTILDGNYSFVEDDSIISPMIERNSSADYPIVLYDVEVWISRLLRMLYLNIRFLEDFVRLYPNLNDPSIANIIMLITKK